LKGCGGSGEPVTREVVQEMRGGGEDGGALGASLAAFGMIGSKAIEAKIVVSRSNVARGRKVFMRVWQSLMEGGELGG
jgi:hypothetical protein